MPKDNLIETIHGPHGLLRRLSEDKMNKTFKEMAEDTRDIVKAEIIARTPEDHGDLRGSVEVEILEDGQGRIRIVASASAKNDAGEDYAPFVEEGTGIFGPRRQMVQAKNAKGMKFFWRKPGEFRDYGGFRRGWWRMKQHHGARGQRFLHRGWRAGMRIARKKFRKFLKE
jgi:hypothetical protein